MGTIRATVSLHSVARAALNAIYAQEQEKEREKEKAAAEEKETRKEIEHGKRAC